MKVIYTKTMVDRFVEALNEAKEKRKEIDFIQLTKAEATVLRAEMNMYPACPRVGFMGCVMGVRVFVVAEADF